MNNEELKEIIEYEDDDGDFEGRPIIRRWGVCPYCGERIDLYTTKCPHCDKEMINKRSK